MSKILVVDDEVEVRELVRQALIKKGYQVTTVATFAQTRDIIFKEPFDLILLDLRLIDGSGMSLLKEIRASSSKVAIVIYSGVVTSDFEKEARLAGANEVLSKNIEVMELAERLSKIVGAKERILKDPSTRADKTILIVDDEVEVRHVLCDFFKRKGYRTLEAQGGQEAIELVRTEKIDIVLLDIRMPKMDGLTTLEKILEINPKLGVLMATAVQDDEKIKKALELGAYGYVLKPFDFLYLELVVMSKLAIVESE